MSVEITADVKQRIIGFVASLSGIYDIRIEPKKNTRSLQQNRAWFGCIVTPFAQWIQDEWGEPCSKLRAHEILKKELAQETIVNQKTGQAFDYILETHTMNTERFSRLMDDGMNFVAKMCGIPITISTSVAHAYGYEKIDGTWKATQPPERARKNHGEESNN